MLLTLSKHTKNLQNIAYIFCISSKQRLLSVTLHNKKHIFDNIAGNYL